MTAYDVITVGGGLGGAALAKTMADRGARVLVLERTREFRDRVRGEVLVPWGCIEAERLGLYDLLHDSIGHELPVWKSELLGIPMFERDLRTTMRSRRPVITYFHPAMQRCLLGNAEDAGAVVRRGVVVKGVRSGTVLTVRYDCGGRVEEASARLVVGADGRGSSVRRWGGFETQTDPRQRLFAGVLMDNLPAPEDTLHSRFNPNDGLMSWLFPQGDGRVRAYVGSHADSDVGRLQGGASMTRFVDLSVGLGVPKDYFEHAEAAGPLASFDATDSWVEHPFRDGVALIGDAAATSDPTWGQGMSLALRDVRVLADALAKDDDWDRAGHAYADAHDEAYHASRTTDGWYTDLLLGVGPEADRRRERALPLLADDPTRVPDTPFDGPEIIPDEEARRRFFGEDV